MLSQPLASFLEIATEATPSWYWLHDHLEDEGFEVKLSHPLKTKAIAHAKVNTDKVDSATLAHLLRNNLLPLSYVPEKLGDSSDCDFITSQTIVVDGGNVMH